MDDLELNANAYLPLRDVVFATLREAILKGELKPGERLMELQLAAKLGVSRTPIREAIRMLQKEGLAVTIPRKGAQVAAMTQKDMEDVLQIREALEILAVQLACESITKPQLAALEGNIVSFEAAVKAKDLTRMAQVDIEFHDMIYKTASNPRLMVVLNHLREQVYRYRVEYLKDGRNHPRLLEEHRQIVLGLKRQDKKYVSEMMEQHLSNQAAAMKDILKAQE